MTRLYDFIKKNPYLSIVLILIVSVGCTFLPLSNLLIAKFDSQMSDYISGFVEQTVVSLLLILLLKRLHLLKQAGFNRKIKDWWVIWPAIVIIFLNLTDVIGGKFAIDTTKPLLIIMFVLVYLSTGLFEETLCRGLILRLFLEGKKDNQKSIYKAVILSGTLFGMIHFIHFFMGQMSLSTSIAQVVYSSCFGIFFGACVIRNQSIYPAILCHGVIDIASSLNEIKIGGEINKSYLAISFSGVVIQITLALPFLVYGLFILRRRKNVIHE